MLSAGAGRGGQAIPLLCTDCEAASGCRHDGPAHHRPARMPIFSPFRRQHWQPTRVAAEQPWARAAGQRRGVVGGCVAARAAAALWEHRHRRQQAEAQRATILPPVLSGLSGCLPGLPSVCSGQEAQWSTRQGAQDPVSTATPTDCLH